jgi:ATP-dependent 26S proteasome regulatory subunit
LKEINWHFLAWLKLPMPILDSRAGFRWQSPLFILTTNRPDQIEPALVSRPGRIDQAIEFPLPDEEGRAKLTKLYARDLQVSDELLDLIVRRTKGISAAFIKELMRRCAQFQIETGGGKLLTQAAVDAALEEMLFAGGALNRRLLGGEITDSSRTGAVVDA